MKNKISLLIAGLFLVSQAAMAQTTQTLTVSASIPTPTSLVLTVTPINASTNVAGTPSTTATTIPFGTLVFNSSLNIYLPTNYFSVGLGTNGAGTPTVDVTYTEGSNPNGTSNGLGTKTMATFVTANTTTGAETVASIGKQILSNLTGNNGLLSSIPTGSYEKVYVGICTGNPTTDATNCKPFTTTDAGGTYTGTLTFTATAL
jgi:hypothetical protein